MKRLSIYILTLWQSIVLLHSQTAGYSIEAIADTLKKDAHSVVHEYRADISIHTVEEGEGTFRKVITVMDKEGLNHADFVCFADKFRTLGSFKGEVVDASGQRVLTIKKSELKSSSLSEGLASDDKTYFYECPYEKYPFTVVYEWDMKYRHGFLAFPAFVPVEEFNQSLVSAQYKLSVPLDMEIAYRTNFPSKPVVSQEKDAVVHEWKWSGICTIERETLGPSLTQLVPILYIKPLEFSYDKYIGKQSSWQELAAWHHSLLQGRDILNEEQIRQIRDLVKDLDNDYDKVKKLYTHMGERMRYVSIQLGIGGLQPMSAAETMLMGFGDCKALSHYLKVMLQTVGIPSDYVIISTIHRNLYADYPNVQQMDHVILKVPLKERTLWLECTNPFIPFGYIHSNIAGHEALVIHSEGGSIERLPHYADSLHTQNYRIEVALTDTPQTLVQVERISSLSQYEDNMSMLRKKADDRKDRIRKNIQLNRATIGEVEVVEKSDSLPTLTERYTLQGMYGNKNGNRLFVPVNPFRQEPFRLSNKERKYDIHIGYGYSDNDVIKLVVPEGYQIETLPKDVSMICPFGHIRSSVVVQENEIIITQSLYVKKGVYSVSRIEEFRAFSETIKKVYGGKIILKKI